MKTPSLKSCYRFPSIGLLLSLFPLQPLGAVEELSKNGEAILAIMPDANNVQHSNYGKKSFTVSNTGSKDIVLFRLDVTESLFPDGVFDPEGIAGDSASKKIEIDEDMDTGIIVPTGISRDVYIGQGGPAGYKTIQLRFRDNGFNPGEKMAFSVDMDPNSAAGTEKSPLDAGSDPKWDVGGVSGAELIGSVFTVTFSDGTTASGQLGGTATQAGSRGIASQIPRSQKVDLRVNGIAPGNVGNYSAGGPEIQVNGPAGTTARVIVAKGFIQPFTPYNPQLGRQLKALANRPFPVNNAVEILTVDIEMTGSPINVSDRFNFSEVAKYDFKSDPSKPMSVDEDKLSLGITAAIIDKNQDGLPLGPLAKPIYLNYLEKASTSDETGFVPLFDGKTLKGWTSAKNTGERNWGDFTVNEAEKSIHVYAGQEEGSKQEHNCLNTEKEYSHYILKLEYKWGGKRFAPRADWDRDAGLLFHVHGDLKKIWPASLEMQIGETPGDSLVKGRRFHTGDLFVLAGNLRVERPVKDGFYHPEGARSMGGHVPTKFGVEKPMGEWNEMEIRVEGAEKATFIFNGEVVFEIFNMQQKIGDDFLPLDKGRIGLQAEWAEILYRNIRIKELPSK